MAPDHRSDSLKQPIELVEYLFRRLHEAGVRSVHGVPGDYNLVALDSLDKCGLRWVGSVNELNAAYASDGYARIKSIAALITTFGVGELSALAGIAGSYAEFVPVVHIVGTPSTASQASGLTLHHTLGDARYDVFSKMSANISCVVAHLNYPGDAASLVDHAIQECYIQSRPAYITLPMDMVSIHVEGERLKTPLELSFPPNDPEQEAFVVDHILELLHKAKNPAILVDACAIRHRALEETTELVERSGLPTFVAPMGKGAVDETLPNFGGVYAGSGSNDGVKEFVESSDLVLSIGTIKSDFNTAGFSYRSSQLKSVDFHSTHVKVKYAEYHGLRMNGVLRRITEKMGKLNVCTPPNPHLGVVCDSSDDQTITHAWFWPQLGDWVQQDDVILTETGTSGYGIWEVPFKTGTTAISQILWGSIGYATASCQGAALAVRDTGKKRRTILFTGEGSFQLTVQELSTIIRHKLMPIIFVVCNDGFTIERFIHGMDASYNDVADWKYKDLVPAFGAEPGSYKTYQLKTKSDVLSLLKDAEFANAPMLKFVELYMPKKDAPRPLKVTAEASAKNSANQ